MTTNNIPLTEAEKATNHDTWTHIHQVQTLLLKCAADLGRRCLEHDQSKLSAPEVSTFTEFTPRLKTAVYGSAEYKGFLRDMKPALDNHYAKNSHHPEHYEHGLDGMNLVDVLEMLCDWIASTKRTKDGDIFRSLGLQKERFGISEQLIQIMRNTLPMLGDYPLIRPVVSDPVPQIQLEVEISESLPAIVLSVCSSYLDTQVAVTLDTELSGIYCSGKNLLELAALIEARLSITLDAKHVECCLYVKDLVAAVESVYLGFNTSTTTSSNCK